MFRCCGCVYRLYTNIAYCQCGEMYACLMYGICKLLYPKNMDNVGQLFFVLKQNLQFMRLVEST